MAKTKRDIFWRISFAYICVALLGLAIVYKVFRIQNIEGSYWRSLSDSLSTKIFTVEPERGNIYTNDGKLLATSLPVFEIRMDMMADGLTHSMKRGASDEALFYDNVRALGDSLSFLFKDQSGSDYTNELVNAKHAKERYHLVGSNVPYTDLMRLKKFPLFKLGQNKGGFIVIQKNKRVYPYNLLAKRTVGYVRDNKIQAVGLEARFNGVLTGEPGKRLMQKVNGGNWIPLNDEQEVDPENGKDVYTTLDLGLQDLAENALMKTLVKNKADHGCVVVMETKTGKIKAMANLGKIKDSTYAETFNYAIGEAHEPGSTFKLASMMSLLEDGYININDTVDIEYGKKRYFNQVMKDAEESATTRMSIKSAFAHSSNVGVSKLVTQYYSRNPEQYIAHLRKFGLDKPIGFEVPGESSPDIKGTADARWSRVSLPWMSVGYELNMTPLRLLTFYNAVANDGVMMKPYIVEAVKEYGKPVTEFKPEVLDPKICSDKTLSNLHAMLEDVVIEGTAHNLLNPDYSVAGKTGTAQIADEKRGYTNKVYQSSFIGYFPANNPIYTIAVVVNNPSAGVYYGAAVAAPVFKEIADNVYASNVEFHPAIAFETKSKNKTLAKVGFKEDINSIYDQCKAKYTIAEDGSWIASTSGKDSTIVMQSREDAEVSSKIPNVVGMGLRDAMYLLENKGLQVMVQGYGTVISQSLKAGGDFKKGQTIQLILGL